MAAALIGLAGLALPLLLIKYGGSAALYADAFVAWCVVTGVATVLLFICSRAGLGRAAILALVGVILLRCLAAGMYDGAVAPFRATEPIAEPTAEVVVRPPSKLTRETLDRATEKVLAWETARLNTSAGQPPPQASPERRSDNVDSPSQPR